MSHAAFMRDAELFPRAVSGDGEAVLALVERYGAQLGVASAAAGDVAAVVAEVFARLMMGALPATDFVSLAAAVPEVVGALGATPERGRGVARRRDQQPVTTEAVVQHLLVRDG